MSDEGVAPLLAYAVEHLTKTYDRRRPPANNDISLAVETGTLLGVFGPNGAGKTTLVRQMMGLLKPTSGAILLFGQDVVRHPNLVPRWVGYYGQKVVGLRNFTAQEVLIFSGALRGLSTRDARCQAAELIARFGMEGFAGKRLATLSGGEQRLAVLLASFMAKPRVLILDEPTNELDPVRRRSLWSYIRDLAEQEGTTLIVTSHNLAEAENVVDRVAIIDGGTLLASGTPGDLKRRVAGLVRLEVRLREGTPASVEARLGEILGSHQIRVGWWEIRAPEQEAAGLLPCVVQAIGFEALDDFRLLTPTLEDVYVDVTGGPRPGNKQ